MYKVLIIDDEEPVREAIKILGEWKGFNIGTILEAADGKAGIRIVEENRPEIILVDMKMPEINGIEFLKVIEEGYPEICRIVISGYDDYEFTRQAIKSKVVDYLLKPVNRNELNNTLFKAIESIKENSKRKGDSINRNIALNLSLPALKEKIFSSILEENFKDKLSQEYLKIIDADNKNLYFGIVVFRITNLEKAIRLFNQEEELLYFALQNVINELNTGAFRFFSFKNPKVSREIIIIVTYDCKKKDIVKELLIETVKGTVLRLSKLFGIEGFASIGSGSNEVLMLGEAYRQARAILYSVNLLCIKDTIITEDSGSKIKEYIPIINRYPLIKNAIENGNQNYIRNILNEYFNEIKDSGYFSLKNAVKAIDEIINMMGDFLLELEVNLSSERSEYNFKSGLNYDVSNFKDFENIICSIMDSYCKCIKKYPLNCSKFDIQLVKEYIDKNYFEEIRITMFVDKFYMSREYLMKLFKQEFGFGIYEYVQKVRMEKAKELLSDDSVKIQNISQMMGYSDHNYFSKAFKNYFGMSPTDYRAMVINQKAQK